MQFKHFTATYIRYFRAHAYRIAKCSIISPFCSWLIGYFTIVELYTPLHESSHHITTKKIIFFRLFFRWIGILKLNDHMRKWQPWDEIVVCLQKLAWHINRRGRDQIFSKSPPLFFSSPIHLSDRAREGRRRRSAVVGSSVAGVARSDDGDTRGWRHPPQARLPSPRSQIRPKGEGEGGGGGSGSPPSQIQPEGGGGRWKRRHPPPRRRPCSSRAAPLTSPSLPSPS